MSEVDWSKAPEGAEYARKYTGKVYWYRSPSVGAYEFFHDGLWHTSNWSRYVLESELIKRPDFQPFTSIEDAQPEPDMVNHPPHYQSDNGIECIDAIRAALGRDGFIAYAKGNVIKYLWREKSDKLEDMRKAAWYLNRAIEEQSK
ncbi:MAG: DUF3310 domain-containing protein [Aeromonadaceae bacterium]